MKNKVEEIFEKSPDNFAEYAKNYSEYLSTLLTKINYADLDTLTQSILNSRETGKKIIFIGNGGSAATASHFANDIGIGTRVPTKPFKALSLTDNNAVMTAIANDNGYDELFLKQLELFLEPGDILIAISASGNSPNLLTALEYAKSKGNKTFGLVGFDGGKMKEICDHSVLVSTAKGEYGPVEDIHMIFDHMIGTYLYNYVRYKQ